MFNHPLMLISFYDAETHDVIVVVVVVRVAISAV